MRRTPGLNRAKCEAVKRVRDPAPPQPRPRDPRTGKFVTDEEERQRKAYERKLVRRLMRV
jgi:hypothetical protein